MRMRSTADRRPMRPSRLRIGAIIGATALTAGALAACSSSGGSSAATGATTAGSSACAAKAETYLKAYQTLPTGLPQSPPARYVPLTSKPPTGKVVDYLTANIPSSLQSTQAATSAATALGWTVKTVIYDGTTADFAAKMDTAISQKPDFIAEGGLPAAAFQKQIDSAKAAGISVLVGNSADQPVSIPGLAGVFADQDVQNLVDDIDAYQFLADSNCQGSVAVYSLDYPILSAGVQEFTKIVKANCSSCDVSTTVLQNQDIGTPAVNSQIVAKLQSSPSTKYVYLLLGNLGDGLPQAMKIAGISGISIFVDDPDESTIAGLRNGTIAWSINQSPVVEGVDMLDAAVRVATTGKTVSDAGGYPLALLTLKNVPGGTDLPTVPANAVALYQKLWLGN